MGGHCLLCERSLDFDFIFCALCFQITILILCFVLWCSIYLALAVTCNLQNKTLAPNQFLESYRSSPINLKSGAQKRKRGEGSSRRGSSKRRTSSTKALAPLSFFNFQICLPHPLQKNTHVNFQGTFRPAMRRFEPEKLQCKCVKDFCHTETDTPTASTGMN